MEKIKCQYCDREFEGFSKKQVDNFLNQHILAKHKDKIKFEKSKKNDKDM